MRNWILIFSSSLSLLFAAFAGCSGDNAGSPASASATSGGGAEPTPCNGNQPNGFCNALGNDPETCDCADCTQAAVCTGTCVEDTQCAADEDCTCADCYMKVDGCPPENVGCNDDGECRTDEDCVCADCTGTPRCTDNCLNNGSCVRYLEGCSCADCMSLMICGGSGPSSSSANSSSSAASSSSMAAGTGGMGAGSTSSSAMASSSANGTGGTGTGGAGGTGG